MTEVFSLIWRLIIFNLLKVWRCEHPTYAVMNIKE